MNETAPDIKKKIKMDLLIKNNFERKTFAFNIGIMNLLEIIRRMNKF